MTFIYDPKRVARLLECLPSLAERLPSPYKEGQAAGSFPGQRITARALYRLLANPQYPHLREALRAIEAVTAGRMTLKNLLAAKSRGEFGSLLAEVLLADHFLSRGLTVSGHSSPNGKNPDLEVAAAGFTATVEVYSPRSWHWREDWLDDVRDTLKNADIPFAFVATVGVAGPPVHADLLQDTIVRTGQDVLRRLQVDLDSVEETEVGAVWRYEHEGSEMSTTVEFSYVEHQTGGLMRSIGIAEPGDSFGADVEFAALIAKIREKAEKRQAAHGEGQIRGLAVDVSRTKLDYFLETGRLTFDASSGLDLDTLGLDFVALTTPRRTNDGPRRGVRAVVLLEDTRITREQVGQLFDIKLD